MGKYEQIIEWVFHQNYSPDKVRVLFNREEPARLCVQGTITIGQTSRCREVARDKGELPQAR